jgi:YidC/Oxa1 family membrane protein insertase
VLAFNLFQPVTDALGKVLTLLHTVVPSYGFDMILIALAVRVALWPLAQQQFKSMAEMQKLQPLLKGLQAKHKGNPQELQAATMSLYKEHGVNPLAGCLPMLIQLPVLFGLYWAINEHVGCNPGDWDAGKLQCMIDGKVAGTAAPGDFWGAHFLWIGSPISQHFPQIFATSLAVLDIPLFVLYIVSMYISVRYGSPPSSDPQQAQTQKIMAFVSPAMIAFFGWKYHFASALLIYWLSLNIFTMAQQFFMYRKFGLVGGPRPALYGGSPKPDGVAAITTNGKSSSARQTPPAAKNGSTSGRSSRRSKR